MATIPWGKAGLVMLLIPLFVLCYIVGRQQRYGEEMGSPSRVVYVPGTLATEKVHARPTTSIMAARRNHSEVVIPPGGRLANRVILEYDTAMREEYQRLVARKVKPDNPDLIKLIRRMIDPPSKTMVKRSRQLFETPQSKEAMIILKNMKNGFFIEAGANDGERASNTLWLEQKMGWTGLLVEPDPYFYTQVLGKSRRSWSINACLSPYPNPSMMNFKESDGGMGTLVDAKSLAKDKRGKIREIPCLPLKSIMLAINQTVVDFFSLDVEGFELAILRTVPWEELEVKTLAVEHAHGREGKQAYKEYMDGVGYEVHKDIHFHDPAQTIFVDDFIFKKRAK